MIKSRPYLLCLGGGIESVPILEQVLQSGFGVIVMDRNVHCPGHLWARYQHPRAFAWLGDVYNSQNALRRARSAMLVNKLNIVGVMCTATDCPDTQALLATHFKTPTIGNEQASFGRNKWKQQQWLETNNVPVPKTRLVRLDVEEKGVEDYDLIKPIAGRGARGVQRLIWGNFKKQLIEVTNYGFAGHTWSAIIQRWIDGVQLSTESTILDGHVLFTAVVLRNYDKLKSLYPYVVENGIDGPYKLKPELYNKLNNLLLRAALVMGWNNITVKGDIVLGADDNFHIIELAPRLSGGYFCSHTIPLAYGHNIVKDAIDLAVGNKPQRQETEDTKFVCQRYLFPRPEQVNKHISSLAPEPLSDYIKCFTYYRKVGNLILEPNYHGARLAQCITIGSNESVARKRAEMIIDILADGLRV